PDDGRRAAHRLVAEIHRPAGLQAADAVVVDDLKDLRLVQPVHGLRRFVVVAQDDLLAVQVEQVAAAHNAAVAAFFVQNREVAVPHAGHDLARVLDGGVHAEFQQLGAAHKVPYRGGGGDQPRRGVTVVGGGDDAAAFLLRARQDAARHGRPA